jgi:class 3 adenylate cyclase
MNLSIDVREILSAIAVPTLVLHRSSAGKSEYFGALLGPPPAASRYVVDRIPGARFMELSMVDGPMWARDSTEVVAAVRQFLTSLWEEGSWELGEPERVLATILFTDIVGSSTRAAELGDARWRVLLQQHHDEIRRQLIRFRGREIDTAGDGFFASFDGPARAIRCACAIAETVRALGLQIRAGLHTGECELIDGKIGGIAVHIGARVAASAAPGEVRASSTVKDLVAGSGIRFDPCGVTELKGVGEWSLYAVVRSNSDART